MTERRERRSFSASRAGFTLVELLVVVAIIALLVTILMPSLQRAKDLTRAAVCLSQIKSTATAFALYHHDNSSYLPSAWRWPVQIIPLYAPQGILQCPASQTETWPDSTGKVSAPLYGSEVYDWEDISLRYVCLDYRNDKKLNIGSGVSYGFNYRHIGWGEPVRVQNVKAGLVMLAENNPGPYQANSYILIDSLRAIPALEYYYSFNPRHQDAGSVFFVDGSAAKLGFWGISDQMWGNE